MCETLRTQLLLFVQCSHFHRDSPHRSNSDNSRPISGRYCPNFASLGQDLASFGQPTYELKSKLADRACQPGRDPATVDAGEAPDVCMPGMYYQSAYPECVPRQHARVHGMPWGACEAQIWVSGEARTGRKSGPDVRRAGGPKIWPDLALQKSDLDEDRRDGRF